MVQHKTKGKMMMMMKMNNFKCHSRVRKNRVNTYQPNTQLKSKMGNHRKSTRVISSNHKGSSQKL